MSKGIAENIRSIIDEKGLKHSAVARRLGLTPNQFSALLCGRRKINDSDIVAICKALNIQPNEIFGF